MKIISVSAQKNNSPGFQGVSSRIECFKNFSDATKVRQINYLNDLYNENSVNKIHQSLTQLYDYFINHSNADLHIVEDYADGAQMLKVTVYPSDAAKQKIRQERRPIDFVESYQYHLNTPDSITTLAKKSAEKISSFLDDLNL